MPERAYKRCPDCHEEKPKDGFYHDKTKKGGFGTYCKVCHDLRARKWEIENRTFVRELNRKRREAFPERQAEYERRYKERYPERRREAPRRWNERNPEKVEAQRKLRKAVRLGQVSKPDSCEDCGKFTDSYDLHGHHEDYSKPLDVDWLCRRCHKKRHAE